MVATTADIKVTARWDGKEIERGTKQAKKDMEGMEKATQMATKAMKGLGAVIGGSIGVATIRQLGMMAIGMNRMASETRAATQAFSTMATGKGINAAAFLREINDAADGTLSRFKQLQVANIALSSGIKGLSGNMGSLIKDVRTVSTALGRVASEDIERVISAINKQEQDLLDELTVVARVEVAYKRYADQLGVTASSLDELQKREAYAALVMEELRKKAESMGDVTNEAGEAAGRLSAAWRNLQDEIGQLVAPEGAMTSLASALSGIADALERIRRGSTIHLVLDPALTAAAEAEQATLGLFGTDLQGPVGNRLQAGRGGDVDALRGAVEALQGFQSAIVDVTNSVEAQVRVDKQAVSAAEAAASAAKAAAEAATAAAEAASRGPDFSPYRAKGADAQGGRPQTMLGGGDSRLDRIMKSARGTLARERGIGGPEEGNFQALQKKYQAITRLVNAELDAADAAEKVTEQREREDKILRDINGAFDVALPHFTRLKTDIMQLLPGLESLAAGSPITGATQLFFALSDVLGGSAQPIERHVDALLREAEAADRASQTLEGFIESLNRYTGEELERISGAGGDLQFLIQMVSQLTSGGYTSFVGGIQTSGQGRISQAMNNGNVEPLLNALLGGGMVNAGESNQLAEYVAQVFEQSIGSIVAMLAGIERAFGQFGPGFMTSSVGMTVAANQQLAGMQPGLGTFGGAMGELRHQRHLAPGRSPGQDQQLLVNAFSQVIGEVDFGNLSWGVELVELTEDQRRTLKELLFDTTQFHQDFLNIFEDPARRAIRQDFDVQEMAFRRTAQKRFAQAGADPFEQAEVLRSLRVIIREMQISEEGQYAALAGGSAGSPIVGPGAAGGSAVPVAMASTSGAITVDLAEHTELLAYSAQSWGEILDISTLGSLFVDLSDGITIRPYVVQSWDELIFFGSQVEINPEDVLAEPDPVLFERWVDIEIVKAIEGPEANLIQSAVRDAISHTVPTQLLPEILIEAPDAPKFTDWYAANLPPDLVISGLNTAIYAALNAFGGVQLTAEGLLKEPSGLDFDMWYTDYLQGNVGSGLLVAIGRGLAVDRVQLMPEHFLLAPGAPAFDEWYQDNLKPVVDSGLTSALRQGTTANYTLLPWRLLDPPTDTAIDTWYRYSLYPRLVDNLDIKTAFRDKIVTLEPEDMIELSPDFAEVVMGMVIQAATDRTVVSSSGPDAIKPLFTHDGR